MRGGEIMDMTMLDTIFWVLWIVVALCLAGQYVMMLLYVRSTKTAKEDNTEGVSIIVVARNEVEYLHTFIPSIIAQDYPRFELIVVDDRSFDSTAVFLSTIQRNYPSIIKIVTVPENTPYPWPGKKFAITMGVKAAKYERIVLMNPAARPASERWLSALSEGFSPSVKYVMAGVSKDKPQSLVEWVDSMLSFSDRTISLTWAHIGRPYDSEASNFSFRKTDFLASNGYMKNIRVPYGVADFLLQDGADDKNTELILSPDAFVHLPAISTWKAYWTKILHRVSAYRLYSVWGKFVKLVFPLSRLSYIGLSIWGAVLFWGNWWYYLLVSLPLILSVVVNFLCAKRLGAGRAMMLSILADVLLLPMYALVALVAMCKIPRQWK